MVVSRMVAVSHEDLMTMDPQIDHNHCITKIYNNSLDEGFIAWAYIYKILVEDTSYIKKYKRFGMFVMWPHQNQMNPFPGSLTTTQTITLDCLSAQSLSPISLV